MEPKGGALVTVQANSLDILYFAWVRTRVGVSRERREIPSVVATVADLVAHLSTLGPGYAEALADLSVIRVAIDQEHAQLDAPIAGAREIAFFPPVTGG